MKSDSPIPTAQYLRMSTEHQQYSMANQSAAIRDYAQQHGFTVVKTYVDAAKTGVVLACRKGLRELLHDVVSGSPGFKAILIYDVNRWGRFQDSDEAAHYEFVCKSSGVPVYYCAEPFVNEGSVPGSLMKALKRTMAGEYSRELSVKVYEAQKRLAGLGIRLGGTAGYGYRRVETSPDGSVRRQLSMGERRGYLDGRLSLVLGPDDEVNKVKEIYSMFLRGRGRIGPTHIAEELNRRGVKFLNGRRWSNQAVRDMLSNPKYAGCAVWGRTTQKLRTPVRQTAPATWTAVSGAVPAIIDQETFDRAQVLLQTRRQQSIPERVLLRKLAGLLRKKGRLSRALLCSANNVPSACTYFRHFGSFKDAYKLVGFRCSPRAFRPVERGRATKRIRDALIETLMSIFGESMEPFRPANTCGRLNCRLCLLLDGKYRLFVYVCPHYTTPLGKQGWFLRPVRGETGGATLLCTLKPGNREIDQYYVHPGLYVTRTCKYTFGPHDRILTESARVERLPELGNVVRRLLGGAAVSIRQK